MSTTSAGIPWYVWALMTVICWGTYGVCMHTGSASMKNPEHGRIMAFLWVGLAYFLTAVIAPIIILKLKGGPIDFWAYPAKGWQWSLIAGTLGAIGALGVLLAFGASPNPPVYVPVVMSIIFAGAPIVNAVVNTTKNNELEPTCSGRSCSAFCWRRSAAISSPSTRPRPGPPAEAKAEPAPAAEAK